MKIITWNVNGIRARAAQVRELVERERPDVLCLQELKARPDQIPAELAALPGYWCYWHGAGPYSGVGLHVRTDRARGLPRVHASGVRHGDAHRRGRRRRRRGGLVYVPNGGKDYAAKLDFSARCERYVADACTTPAGSSSVRRPQRRAHRSRRASDASASRTPSASAPTSGRCSSGVIARGMVDVGRAPRPRQRRPVHLVGAVAQPAPAQHRLAHRLHVGERRRRAAGASRAACCASSAPAITRRVLLTRRD